MLLLQWMTEIIECMRLDSASLLLLENIFQENQSYINGLGSMFGNPTHGSHAVMWWGNSLLAPHQEFLLSYSFCNHSVLPGSLAEDQIKEGVFAKCSYGNYIVVKICVKSGQKPELTTIKGSKAWSWTALGFDLLTNLQATHILRGVSCKLKGITMPKELHLFKSD